MDKSEIIQELVRRGNPVNVAGMARFGIRSKKVLGVPMPALRAMARKIGKDHRLAGRLWRTGILEARVLAALVDVAAEVTPDQMEAWAADFDNWAVCDGACGILFDKTPWAYFLMLSRIRRTYQNIRATDAKSSSDAPTYWSDW